MCWERPFGQGDLPGPNPGVYVLLRCLPASSLCVCPQPAVQTQVFSYSSLAPSFSRFVFCVHKNTRAFLLSSVPCALAYLKGNCTTVWNHLIRGYAEDGAFLRAAAQAGTQLGIRKVYVP